MIENFEKTDNEITWCPGCGNYEIRNSMLLALNELNIPKKNIVFVSIRLL